MNNKTNIEEDIKILNNLKENVALFSGGWRKILTERETKAIENILADRERLEKENNNLNNILKAGLSKEKQYCFNEDGNTGKCLGYGTFVDDEPCDYCKTCEKLSIKEND